MTPLADRSQERELEQWLERARGDEPILCVQCGKEVERARRIYVLPTCYECLPPPPPLEILELP